MNRKSINRNVWALTLSLSLGYSTLGAQAPDRPKAAEKGTAEDETGDKVIRKPMSGRQGLTQPISACPPGTVSRPPDMVAWWPLDETQGTAVVDLAGHDNTGTTVPAAIGAGGPAPYPGNHVGNSLAFASGRYVEVADAPNLNFASGDFTIDAWVKFGIEQYSQTEPAVHKWDSTGGYSLYIEENSTLNIFGLKMRIGPTIYAGPTIQNIHVGKWIFVAATRSGNTVRLYVGPSAYALAAAQTSGPTQNASSSTPLRIGGWPNTNTNPGHIIIDEVEIFRRALTQDELDKIWRAGSKGKCKPRREVAQ